ncbi:6,7-dimethyl-8-ribityllumazine synthase [Robbsia sp. Bb-Pol-6]|uniref:6,7-dimethyl-8-ribityllumazine synthase n=1 Tax=Robbsia betulipollinis TaxID=2981849 RepID=A0ABT3ZKH0_9BURK|nr:6,7-dimethyl-8-ribityllumazine synthase [Robbsia betulipollinis]MCY0387029.1 6,7-dimethyl-8-ribityllumazine synthase [Robbsia betulipollinis]
MASDSHFPQDGVPASRSRATRIAFIQSAWHKDIVDQTRQAFAARMQKEGHRADAIDYFEVPGAFEIPLHAKLLAQRGDYAAIVAAGLVVDGGIYRHDFVASAVIDGLMRVQLDSGVPVFSAVLTPHHFHGGDEHVGFFREHFLTKGDEVAQACVRTLRGIAAIVERGAAARALATAEIERTQ